MHHRMTAGPKSPAHPAIAPAGDIEDPEIHPPAQEVAADDPRARTKKNTADASQPASSWNVSICRLAASAPTRAHLRIDASGRPASGYFRPQIRNACRTQRTLRG
jgi:hypothetical protein